MTPAQCASDVPGWPVTGSAGEQCLGPFYWAIPDASDATSWSTAGTSQLRFNRGLVEYGPYLADPVILEYVNGILRKRDALSAHGQSKECAPWRAVKNQPARERGGGTTHFARVK